ncbi:MAG: GlsB/YeaQ/YmgE family stress response membrane protein [Phycisphaerae bacterium]|jgi:uncharacterized membrane protein YeaQ/YmgE (transglycosylase-associated protein family)|nr:GlsB/YeaQ/YmgE family stress response membrane protein [Phycisphaerae bacterium]
MDFVWFLLIGLAAGYLAGQIMKRGSAGIVGDLIIGVIGAILGGAIIGFLGFRGSGLLASLITATVGAIVLLVALNFIRKR